MGKWIDEWNENETSFYLPLFLYFFFNAPINDFFIQIKKEREEKNILVYEKGKNGCEKKEKKKVKKKRAWEKIGGIVFFK